MKEKLNYKFLSILKQHLPEDKKIMDYLIQRFGLSREAAYRRIQGTVPFSVDETINMAGDFGFSLDKVIGHKSKHIPYSLEKNMLTKTDIRFMETFEFISNCHKRMQEAQKAQTTIFTQRFSEFLNVDSDPLFRFFYYKYLHQVSQISPSQTLSETIVPEEIMSTYHKFKEYFAIMQSVNRQNELEMILDNNYFKATMDQIAYFFKRKLISREEFGVLKDEILKDLEYGRRVSQNGSNKNGFKHSFFLSSLNIDSNFTFFEYDNTLCSMYWAYPINPMIIYDKETYSIQKKWIQSYKKYATLFSESNEMLQSNFFDSQIEHIEKTYKISEEEYE